MRRLMSCLGLGFAPLALVSIALTAACSKGSNGPTAQNNVPAAQAPAVSPVSNNPQPYAQVVGTGICEGKPTWASKDGSLTICELEKTLDLQGNVCQFVTDQGGSWTIKVGIISTGKGYLLDGTFGVPETGCGAVGVGSPGQGNGPANKKTFPAGESTYTFSIVADGGACGRVQNDVDAVNEATGAKVNVFGIVLNYAKPCTTCADISVSSSQATTETGKTETLVITSKIPYTITWGDGATEQHKSSGTFTHSYATGTSDKTYNGSVSSQAQFAPCTTPFSVVVPGRHVEDSCANYTAPVFGGDLGITLGTTQATITSGTVTPAGGSFNPTLPANVNRPNAGQPDATFSTTYTKSYGPENLRCSASHVYTKAVPAKGDTCDNYTPPSAPNWSGSLALSNETATTETVTVGSVSPSDGSFNPALPDTVTRTGSDWSFSTTETKVISYGPQNLECSRTFQHAFSITIPKIVVVQGACYYRVSCGAHQTSNGGVHGLKQDSCTDQNQQNICEATFGGNPSAHGIWRNFGDANLLNHCQFTVPGVSLDNFQLNPGQSDHACLNKNSN